MGDFWRETILAVIGELDIVAQAAGEFGNAAYETTKPGATRKTGIILALGRLDDARTRLAALQRTLNDMVLE